ncbi:MAG: hypothetical protein ACREA2_11840 [Blastocatellia bacterium]
MPTPEISEYNSHWGICGFTSAMTHFYDSDERLKSKIDSRNAHTIRLGLLTEVVTFLKYVTASRSDLIDDLNKLNTDLKSPSMKGGVAGFIPLAEKAVREQKEIGESNEYQCALTPEAMTLYLQEICSYKNAKLTRGADPGGRGILGLMNAKGALVHWVYRAADGNVYNWGAVITPEKWATDPKGLGHRELKSVGYHISFG